MSLSWDQLRIKLVFCNRILCEPGWRLAPEWSTLLADFDMWYVFKGKGTMQLAGQRVALRPGVCFWMRPGGTYLGEQAEDDRLGVNALHFEVIDPAGTAHRDATTLEAAGVGTLPPEHHVLADAGYGDTVLRRVIALTRPPRAGDAMARGVAERLLAGFLMDLDLQASSSAASTLSGTEQRHQEIVAKAAMRIDESPGECPPIREIARQAGYSLDHFTRVFKQSMAMSPQEYLIRARIDRARRLLHESSLSISQIAAVLGYTDVYFFSRQFKQKTGLAPRDYRVAPIDAFDAH